MNKMLGTCHDLSQNPPQIKQDDKFISTRLLSKESSMANPSLRVYYGGAPGSVPFIWESQPGTPKHNFTQISLPPLTPPPSYYSNHNTKNHSRKYSRTKFLKTLFLRVNDKKERVKSSPSSLWSLSWSSSATSNFWGRSRFSSMDSSFFEGRNHQEEEKVSIGSSHSSIMCFGGGGKGYSIVVMKKKLLAMVGCGSG